MLVDLPKYAAHKPSGVAWLGEVPTHWEIRKLRHVLKRVVERNRHDMPLLSVVREKGVILRDTANKEENRNYIPDDLGNYKVVLTGQFAMNKMKAWQGSYGVSRYDGIVSPAYFVFSVAAVEGQFFHTAIRSRAYVPFFAQASDGIRIGQWDLAEARMKEVPFLVPPLPEQRAIVRYLDHHDRLIRRYLRSKRRLIALLEEQKQAIIQQAVTRGLDPSVPMKDSGIEWLGQIPAHWQVRSVRRLITFITSGSRGWARFYSDDGEFFVQSGDLDRNMALSLQKAHRVSVPPGAEGLRTRILRGDVLVCITGALTGNVAHVPEQLPPAYVNQHLALLRPRVSQVVPRFLGYTLYSEYAQRQFGLAQYGGTKQGLGLDDVRNVNVVLPPLAEQNQIINYLDASIEKLACSLAGTRREIELMREYRTRLIADVVTGKLDVRAASAALPEVGCADEGQWDKDDQQHDDFDANDEEQDDQHNEQEGR